MVLYRCEIERDKLADGGCFLFGIDGFLRACLFLIDLAMFRNEFRMCGSGKCFCFIAGELLLRDVAEFIGYAENDIIDLAVIFGLTFSY